MNWLVNELDLENNNNDVVETGNYEQDIYEEVEVGFMGVPADIKNYVYWENIACRKILLNGEVDENIIESVVMQIHKFNDEDMELPVEARIPIILFINSIGGDADMGLHVYDVIKSSQTPVFTVAQGRAASSGGIMLLAGHKRFAYTNSLILFHEGSSGMSGNTRHVWQTAEFYKRLVERIGKIIVENTKITEEEFENKRRDEWYMFGDEALELGIVDEIL